MIHADGVSGSTVFYDENTTPQVIYSTGTTYASATSIELADYHQFGAEIRSLGSAAIFGNTGVTADGTGTDIKLIAFNMSHIGAGKDSTDDISLVVQANEVIQLNGGEVYFQTVDQGGDFRVGNSFLVNQRTGDVSFGEAKVNLSNLGQLTVTDGVNNTVILPTSVSVGSLVLSGGSLVTHSGDLTLDPAGTLTTINSDVQVNGTASISGITNISNQSASTSTNTGALIVLGGVGIGGNLYVAGKIVAQELNIQLTTVTTTLLVTDDIISTYNTTVSTGTTTGALQIAGGAGIGGDVNIGGRIVAGGVRSTTGSSSPADPTVGDMWYNTNNDRMYRYTANGVIDFWLDYTGPVVQYLNNF
jgi:hypothetical protein